MLIDTHTHFYPESLIQLLLNSRTPPFLEKFGQTLWFVTHSGKVLFDEAYITINARLKFMADNNIGLQAISFPGSLGIEDDSSDQVIRSIIGANSEIIDVCRQHQGSLYPICTLPVSHVDVAIEEFRRILDLGVKSVILPASLFINIPAWIEHLLSVINQAGGTIMVHPDPHAHKLNYFKRFSWIGDSVFDLMSQVSASVIEIWQSGIYSVFSGIKWHFIALGGSLPFFFHRLEQVSIERGLKFSSEIPANFYFDTASMSIENVSFALNIYGYNNIVVGSDFPVFRKLMTLPDLDDEVIAAISYKNAARMLDLQMP